jgi:hypothetical protein
VPIDDITLGSSNYDRAQGFLARWPLSDPAQTASVQSPYFFYAMWGQSLIRVPVSTQHDIPGSILMCVSEAQACPVDPWRREDASAQPDRGAKSCQSSFVPLTDGPSGSGKLIAKP